MMGLSKGCMHVLVSLLVAFALGPFKMGICLFNIFNMDGE